MMYKVVGYCRDCTYINDKGCNDGIPWDLGTFDNEKDAEIAKSDHEEDCSPYYARIIPLKNKN